MSGLRITRPREAVVLIEIDAPPANALNHALRTELEAELGAIEVDLGVRAVVLTGAERRFCAGDDLREASQRGEQGGASLGQFGRLLDAVERLRAPVIAAVNGPAVGGGLELALCCDIRLASTAARFQGAGVNVGLMASVYRLPRLIGVGPAKAMLLTGLPADAATALRYGLVTGVSEPEQLLEDALALAERIATRAPLSVEAAKRMIGRALDLDPPSAAREAGQELRVLATSQDHKRAVRAFLAKETPRFERD